MEALTILPAEIRRRWGASLLVAEALDETGKYKLVGVKSSKPKTLEVTQVGGVWKDMSLPGVSTVPKIKVQVLDDAGLPLTNVQIAFAYEGEDDPINVDDWDWLPPEPLNGDLGGNGVDGSVTVVEGEELAFPQSGFSIYVAEPDYSSDALAGVKRLSPDNFLEVTFQLQSANPPGPIGSRIDLLERFQATLDDGAQEPTGRLIDLEGGLATVGTFMVTLDDGDPETPAGRLVDIEDELATKASTQALTNGLATKASATDLTNGLAAKADVGHAHGG